jgi:hypothetical protein
MVFQLQRLLGGGEDRGRRHESGGDGMLRHIGRDVERDGHKRGASGGMDTGLHATCVRHRREKLRPDRHCLWSKDGHGACVARGSGRALGIGAGAVSGLTPRSDVQVLVPPLFLCPVSLSTYMAGELMSWK